MSVNSKDAICGWIIETLDHRVDAELAMLPADQRARFVWIATLLREAGPQKVREPYVKPLGEKLWEMRMKGKDGIARAIYLAAIGKRLVVVHVFVKKTQKTPRAALETAMRRAEEAGLL
ncbi:type II toxin-antitoxin system RelE/ParE family toxin [Rhodospirillum rubrum]|uniref:type II toxin-antitoxin system RelE/ParE family toxin n=1 Tax=Rhodospirillum rubrum TaxID=1085 RepID=UPI001ED91142|nr:type II toxin-antitoxin system RelE/ParE family toxin [Rhodospirillum rubrum]